jgi:hypothetical protein
MSLMQRLANMQFQLQEAREHNELDQFILDQKDDLNTLLIDSMWAILKDKITGAA